MSQFDSNDIGITVLGSGSSGNATLIHCGRQAIMIDAGFSFKELRTRIKECGLEQLCINGILVTHEHTDHINGLRVCSEKLEAPVYATRGSAAAIRRKDPRMGQMATFAPGACFDIGDFTICPFLVSHDADEPVAFTVFCHDVKIGVATDVGYVSSGVEYNLKSCDMLVVESNHDLNMLAASQRPWSLKQRIMGRQGHLSNNASGQLLERIVAANTHDVVLAHISRECNTIEKAHDAALEALDSIRRDDIALSIAEQARPHETIWHHF
ncbi:MAG: MBL fold metallo-hydrolase [Victivallales bacterium]|nr:MBL fold metallo-hydrolase [Victivallales bacterium]